MLWILLQYISIVKTRNILNIYTSLMFQVHQHILTDYAIDY